MCANTKIETVKKREYFICVNGKIGKQAFKSRTSAYGFIFENKNYFSTKDYHVVKIFTTTSTHQMSGTH